MEQVTTHFGFEVFYIENLQKQPDIPQFSRAIRTGDLELIQASCKLKAPTQPTAPALSTQENLESNDYHDV